MRAGLRGIIGIRSAPRGHAWLHRRVGARARVGRLAWIGLAAALSGAVPAPVSALTVFAAASTGTALTEIATAWEAETGRSVTLSLAGTSALARQIEAGAPVDVFISASPDWMDHLAARDRLVPATRRALLGNRLVIVGPADATRLALDAPDALSDRLGSGRLAVAFVDAVPAGIYARAALQSLGLWDSVADRMAQTDSVRAALALVALRAAPLGVVYASDARAEPRVGIVADIPPDAHPPIVYPAAAIAGGDVAAATAFLDYLQSAPARAAFARQGFALFAAD